MFFIEKSWARNLAPYCIITVASHERHYVSNHRKLHCWLNSLIKLTQKKKKFRLTDPSRGDSDQWIPLKRTSGGERDFISWHHHILSKKQIMKRSKAATTKRIIKVALQSWRHAKLLCKWTRYKHWGNENKPFASSRWSYSLVGNK